MKVTIRKLGDAQYSVYVPKKDLEEAVLSVERPGFWGGPITLKNGMRLEMPEMPEGTRFPITVEARRLDD